MAIGWWPWFGSPGCQVNWFGEDGVVYTDASNTTEQTDANGNVVTNGLPRAIEQVRYYNLNTFDWHVRVTANDGSRPPQTYTLTAGAPAWATFSVNKPSQMDPSNVSATFYR
jgi:hypothetical protein